MRLQHFAHVLGDIRHRIEIGDAANVKPVPELADAHAHLLVCHPLLAQRLAHLFTRQPNQRRLPRQKVRPWHQRFFHRIRHYHGFGNRHAHDPIRTAAHLGAQAPGQSMISSCEMRMRSLMCKTSTACCRALYHQNGRTSPPDAKRPARTASLGFSTDLNASAYLQVSIFFSAWEMPASE